MPRNSRSSCSDFSGNVVAFYLIFRFVHSRSSSDMIFASIEDTCATVICLRPVQEGVRFEFDYGCVLFSGGKCFPCPIYIFKQGACVCYRHILLETLHVNFLSAPVRLGLILNISINNQWEINYMNKSILVRKLILGIILIREANKIFISYSKY